VSGPLAGRNVVLGVCGSIAAYKAAEVASRLVQAGALVDTALTASAARFVQPLTFAALTGREPYVDMFAGNREAEPHVELARRADLMLIAPASATTMARLAHGLADDMVSLTALATQAPLLLAPAMDSQMWEHAATRANVALLRERGVEFLGPVEGRLASGRVGAGRLVEPEAIVELASARLGRERGDLPGRRVIVTAGGTREPADPVRFISNRSSGRMGYALARAARDRGAEVVLISSAELPPPPAVEVVRVESAGEMLAAVRERVADADALVMAAAVADYRPAEILSQKRKRAGQERLSLELTRNEDIIASVPAWDGSGRGLIKVAFAAETQDLLDNAARKLVEKDAHLVVANDVTAKDAGFGVETNRIVILDRTGRREALPLMSKYDCAWRVLDRVAELLAARDAEARSSR
jgi:phosphopantothenoylcysteine decarboxylase/phosphopantothenate--cysteine ligase